MKGMFLLLNSHLQNCWFVSSIPSFILQRCNCWQNGNNPRTTHHALGTSSTNGLFNKWKELRWSVYLFDLYTCFRDCTPATVISYFNEQWQPIRKQWIMGMKYKTDNFLNGTNNRLECINQKLKSVIGHYSSLEECIDKFFLILRVLWSECDHKVA